MEEGVLKEKRNKKKQADIQPAINRAPGFDITQSNPVTITLTEDERIKISSPFKGFGGR